MAEGSISTSDLPSYVLDGLFDSFGDETILDDDYVKNYDVGKLNNETDHDSSIILYRYLTASDNKNYRIKPEQDQCTSRQCNTVQLILLADCHTFQNYITSQFTKYIFGFQILTWNEFVNFVAHHWICPTKRSLQIRSVGLRLI